jgi:hypothetical protein
MRKIIFSVLLCAPLMALAASAHMDVINMEFQEGCSMDQFMGIVSDFNEWGADYGYHARIAMPLQNDDLGSFYWLGESADAATFGAAWDAWRDALANADSVPAQLQTRFEACVNENSRTGYDVY